MPQPPSPVDPTSGRDGTVVVLNFQGEQWLGGCLASLMTQTATNFEVIVVDNGSTDRSADIASSYDVRWVPLGANTGFSRGNNAGAKLATGDWIIFVNNDTKLLPNFVTRVATTLAENPDVFAVDVAHSDFAGQRSHGAVRVVLTPRRLLGRRIKFVESYPSEACEVSFACGGAIGVRRSVFAELGGFDERMLAGWEDTDLCWRAWLLGHKTVYEPEVLCEHKIGGASATPQGRILRRRGVIIGRLVMTAKLLPAVDAMSDWAVTAPRGLTSLDLFKPVTSAIRMLPRLTRERRAIFRTARVTPKQFLRRMTELNP